MATDATSEQRVQAAIRSLKFAGHCWTGNVRQRDALIAEGGTRSSAAYWDRPDHLPWLIVSQTPCLREDLGREEPKADPSKVATQHTCRLKHVHNGSRHDLTEVPDGQ